MPYTHDAVCYDFSLVNTLHCHTNCFDTAQSPVKYTSMIPTRESKSLSLLYGPTDSPLLAVTLGALTEVQARIYGDRTAVVFPEQNIRRSYRELFQRSRIIAKALIELGMQHGECVGIFAGNCCEFVEVVIGAAAMGCPTVVLNGNYTPDELEYAVKFSGGCWFYSGRLYAADWLVQSADFFAPRDIQGQTEIRRHSSIVL